MSDVDTPFAEPISMQDAMAKVDSLMEAKEAAPEEPAQEPEPTEAAEAETPAEVAEPEQDDAESSQEEEGPQVLTVDEYGDVLVDVSGEATSLNDLVKGTLRQSDYSRKTMALKEREREITAQMAEREKSLAEREARILELETAQGEAEPDWVKLAEEDPLGWPAKKAEWEARQTKRRAAEAEQQKQNEAQLAQFRQQTATVAVGVFPEWQDPAKFEEGAEARKQAALSAGFTEDEYNSTPDFRIAVLLEKARLYDEGKAKTKNVVQKKIATAPKVLKPGAASPDRDPAEERRAARQKRLREGPVDMNAINKMIGR